MDPLNVLATYGPLILMAVAAGLGIGIRRALGRVEGTIAPFAERLSRHSEKIHALDVALVRLENLPGLLAEWREQAAREHAALDAKLETLSEMWREGVNHESHQGT